MEEDRPFPDDLLAEVTAAFGHIDAPLSRLLTDRLGVEVKLIARTMFFRLPRHRHARHRAAHRRRAAAPPARAGRPVRRRVFGWFGGSNVAPAHPGPLWSRVQRGAPMDETLEGPAGSIADVALVRSHLVAAARRREAMSYSELLLELGHRFTRPKMRALCRTLDAIDRAAAAAARARTRRPRRARVRWPAGPRLVGRRPASALRLRRRLERTAGDGLRARFSSARLRSLDAGLTRGSPYLGGSGVPLGRFISNIVSCVISK